MQMFLQNRLFNLNVLLMSFGFSIRRIREAHPVTRLIPYPCPIAG